MNRLQSLKMMVASMAAAPILIAIVFAVGQVLPDSTLVLPGEAVVTGGISLLTGLVSYFLVPRMIQPLEPDPKGEPQPADAMARIQSITPIAAAIAETGFMVALALSFVNQYTGGAVLVAAPVGALAVYFAAFPTESRITTYKTRLESVGGRTGL